MKSVLLEKISVGLYTEPSYYGKITIQNLLKEMKVRPDVEINCFDLKLEMLKYITKELKLCKSLQCLRFRTYPGRIINAKKAKLIAKALENNKVLYTFQSWVVISNEGIKYICKALKKNNYQLTNVILCLEKMDVKTMKNVCKVFKKNTVLKSIHLYWNYISLKALKYLVNLLKFNITITDLGLRVDVRRHYILGRDMEYLYDKPNICNNQLYLNRSLKIYEFKKN